MATAGVDRRSRRLRQYEQYVSISINLGQWHGHDWLGVPAEFDRLGVEFFDLRFSNIALI